MQTHLCQGHDMNGHLEIFQNVNRVYRQMIALHVILSFLFFPFDSPINVKSTFISATSAHKRKLFYIVTDIYLAQGLSS